MIAAHTIGVLPALTLAPEVHLIGSGWLGFGISSDYDCNVYVIHAGDEAVIIDAGSGLGLDRICANLRESGVSEQTVSRIFLTHAHADHAAGARTLAERLDAAIWCSDRTASVLEAGDEEAIGLVAARRDGVYPAAVELRPTTISRRIASGRVDVGGLTLEAVPTDGHSAGHLSFILESKGTRFAFCGDLIFARGRIVLLDLPDSDEVTLIESIERLAAAQPDALLPGHGELVLEGAQAHLHAALRRYEWGQRPEAFLG